MGPSPRTRRVFLGVTAGALATAWAMGLGEVAPVEDEGPTGWEPAPEGDPRLSVRPGRPTRPAATGLHRLGLDETRDGLLYLPASLHPDRPAPLAVAFHGARADAEAGLALLRDHADAAGLVVLAPSSRGPTWDGVTGRFGPDVAFVDRALASAFDRCHIDPRRVAACGFSDGASYALGLGLADGDLFTHVVAFSPSYLMSVPRRGRPRLFVSHGTRDEALPIATCSRRIVPRARRAGLDVTYREFDGPHAAPPTIAREAVAWIAAG